MKVVVVESPAKAKTINKYLGSDFVVVASVGHVRDLEKKDGAVDPDHDFDMRWDVHEKSRRVLADIASEVKRSEALYLATDPDREGEAISWHLLQCLTERRAIKDIPVQRVVFNEITKTAVLEAFKAPRAINQELVDAYRARRALDYLVGYTLSPVLWRKLPGARSAGRVQSVALRLITEREAEIEAFKAEEYWSVAARVVGQAGDPFQARLTHLDGNRLDRLSIKTEADAKRAQAAIEARRFAVGSVDRRQVRRHPQPPFTTSTLQQEASRKLGYGATRTMQIAQRLYEGVDLDGETVGLISYMRTDGVQLSAEAVTGARTLIEQDHGRRYLPDAPRVYKTKAKNAQEAHEAVRPTDFQRRPAALARYLEPEQLRLYELIWKRAVASQMESAVLDQVSVDLAATDGQATLRATGSVVVFDGYLALYQEGRDDAEDEAAARLPNLATGEAVTVGPVETAQHFTQPPPRYTEASLVKKLEELGIGRPSTYASIIQVLQEREYVRLEQRRFVPEDRGRVVTAFLAAFFERYVEYSFTADLEDQLDEISGGRADWREVLRQFWGPFIAAVQGTKDLKIGQVIDTLDQVLGPHFFPDDGSGRNPRACPACADGRLGLRLGRTGGFIGCSNYPACRYTRPLAIEEGDSAEGADLVNPRLLGEDPETGRPVTLRKGPFGIYIQLGEAVGEEKPKRVSVPKGEPLAELGLERALALLALPRELGVHPDSRKPVTAGIGRFGPYIKHGPVFVSVPADEDVLSIGLNRAVTLLAEAKPRGAQALRVLGEHPTDGREVALFKGRYGPYVAHGKTNVTLPKEVDADALTLEQAVMLLNAKAPAKKGKAAPKGKSTAKSTPKAAAPKAAKPAEAKAKPAASPKRRPAAAKAGAAANTLARASAPPPPPPPTYDPTPTLLKRADAPRQPSAPPAEPPAAAPTRRPGQARSRG